MIRHYLRTLCYPGDDGKWKLNLLHATIQIGVPVIGAIASHLLGIRIDQRQNIFSLISVITGLMCTVAALLFETRTSTLRSDSLTTHRDENSVDELFYLCCWLIVAGILGSLLLFLPDLSYPVSIPILLRDLYSCVCMAFVLHFAMAMSSFATRFIRIYIRTAEHRD